MKATPLLQTATSRDASIRVKIANQIWDTTGSAFFEEEIPFSSRNNQRFAKRLLAAYQHLTKNQPEPSFLVVELGAGLGFLSYFFLESLKRENPALYQKTQFWSTDIQASVFEKLKKHKNCTTKKIDMLSPNFEGQTPILCFSSYMLDAIPPKCLHLSTDGVQEIKFETQIAATSIPDPCTLPPTMIAVDTLTQPFPRHLLPYIADHLEEIPSFHPWDPTTVSEEDAKTLDAFKKSGLEGYFNFIPGLSRHLASMTKQLHPNGAYITSDFGFTNTLSTHDSLASRYQLALFHSVCFPLLRHIAQAEGLCVAMTNREMDQTQECIISKLAQPALLTYFDTDTPDDGLSKRLDTQLQRTDSEFLTHYPQFRKSLSEDDKTDYVVCKLLASRLFRLGQFKEVMLWAEHMETVFGNAPDAYLISGWVCQLQKDHKNAIGCFQTAIQLSPQNSMAYGAAAASALALGDIKHAQLFLDAALLWARGDAYWIHIVTQCTLWYRTKNLSPLKTTLLWIKTILTQEPNRIPERVKAQLTELIPGILT